MNFTRVRAALSVLLGSKPGGLSTVDSRDRGWTLLFGGGAPGSFQHDTEASPDEQLAFFAVYSCLTQIASDIAKLPLRLMERSNPGIWGETSNAAYSPVLRKPNHYQNTQQFIETWMLSKRGRYGNFYGLKERDARGVVVRIYPLDPSRVTPLVAPDGSVFYELRSDDLSKLPVDIPAAPASEIIHDRAECLFHPLIGVSPLFACGLAASQGLKIQANSAKFFENMSRPSGVLTAPGQISDPTAKRLKETWEQNFSADKIGRVAVLGDGLKYDPMSVTPKDSELVDQLKLSAEQVCSAFHVPPFMVGIGLIPSADNVQALTLRYYSQCLQRDIEAIERLLDDGLALDPVKYRTEFDLDDLMRMDSKTLAEVEGVKVQRGIASPDEARRKFNLPPVTGGSQPYLQQQNYSLEALARRDAQEDPFGTAKPPAPPPEADETDKALHLLWRKSPEAYTHG